MSSLMNLTIDLIENHGQYSEIYNSCQDFAVNFVIKCADKDEKVALQQSTDTKDAHVLGSMVVGTLAGASIGSALAGPAGAVDGALYGQQAGLLLGNGSYVVANHSHKNKANGVKLLDNDQ